jgi:hypothetical protein
VRSLALPVLAAALALAVPAPAAQAACTGTFAGACVTAQCQAGCRVVVDPYCDIPGPVILACVWLNDM